MARPGTVASRPANPTSESARPGSAGSLSRGEIIARNIGVGCITTFAGFFSGGMIAVLIAKLVGSTQGCRPPEGLPACNWWVYAGVGAVVGALTLPVLALRRLNPGKPNE